MIYYLPLEHLDIRYTKHLDRDIRLFLKKNKIKHTVIEPEKVKQIKNGSFLDSATTIMTKSKQIYKIAELYKNDTIKNGDVIFTTDLWFPGIESISYLNYFHKKNVKIKGVLHAGSFTDTDFVRDLERWAKNFEDIVFDISDKIFVASNFIYDDILRKRIVNSKKISITGLPLDFKNLEKYKNTKKENIIVFNGRNVDEKQPWLFDQLKKDLPQYTYVNTQKLNLNKHDYYKLLNKSKIVVSFALQENFGYGIQEAVYLGCIPIVPDRLVYKEQFDKKYRYSSYEECKEMINNVFNNNLKPIVKIKNNNDYIFRKWFL